MIYRVLSFLADVIKKKLPLSTHFTADLDSDDYNFSQHITPTDLKSEVGWLNDEN